MSPLPATDTQALQRILRRMVGNGFKLAVVELNSPVQRAALLEWLGDQCTSLEAQLLPVDLSSLPGQNLWMELKERLGTLPPRTVLVPYGLEETEHRPGGPGLIAQLNVQRDLFVRDFPVVWVLLSHPSLRMRLMLEAPDFSDFVAWWVEAEVAAVRREIDRSMSLSRGVHLPPLPLKGPANEASDIFEQTWLDLDRWRLDATRDGISRLHLRELTIELKAGLELAEAWLELRAGSALEAQKLFIAARSGPFGEIARLGLAEATAWEGRLEVASQELARCSLSGDWEITAAILKIDILNATDPENVSLDTLRDCWNAHGQIPRFMRRSWVGWRIGWSGRGSWKLLFDCAGSS